MIPYFLLLIIPLLFQLGKNNRLSFKRHTVRFEEVVLPVFFILFLLILALRFKYLGRDLYNYEDIFIRYGKMDLISIFSDFKEFIFRLYCWAFYNLITNNYQLFVSVTGIISVLPLMHVYCKDKSQGYLKASIFVNMSTFIMLFSGIRQGMAFSIGILAYQALVEKKYARFVLCAFIAMLIHHTGFMILFMLPLYFMRFKKRDLIWIIPAIALVMTFNAPIFNFLSSFLSGIDDHYGVLAGETGAYMEFVLFAMFSMFVYIVEDENKMDNEAFFLRNSLIFALVIQSFASVNYLAMRMSYYYIILIPIAVGKSVSLAKDDMVRVARTGKLVMSVFFTVYFLYEVFVASKTGISALDNYPYMFFWEG